MRAQFLEKHLRNYTLLAVLALSGASFAQSFTPNLTETGGVNTAFRNAPRAYASYIDESLFSSITQPVFITGIRFRLMAASLGTAAQNPPANWPSQTLNFSDFTMKVGEANSAIAAAGEIPSLTGTFNSLFAPGATTVRTGALTLNSGDFPFNSASTPTSPNGWGATISFASAYLYNPGTTLMYAISHSGYAPSTEFQPFFAVANFGVGVADAVSSTTPTAGLDSTIGGFSSPYVVQFETTPVPEPATMSLLALAGLAAARKRKRS